MDVSKMLAELHAERSAIEDAIIVLERLAANQGKRRGRPPAWMSAKAVDASSGQSEGPNKRFVSPEARARMAAAQRRRWAAKRAAAKTKS